MLGESSLMCECSAKWTPCQPLPPPPATRVLLRSFEWPFEPKKGCGHSLLLSFPQNVFGRYHSQEVGPKVSQVWPSAIWVAAAAQPTATCVYEAWITVGCSDRKIQPHLPKGSNHSFMGSGTSGGFPGLESTWCAVMSTGAIMAGGFVAPLTLSDSQVATLLHIPWRQYSSYSLLPLHSVQGWTRVQLPHNMPAVCQTRLGDNGGQRHWTSRGSVCGPAHTHEDLRFEICCRLALHALRGVKPVSGSDQNIVAKCKCLCGKVVAVPSPSPCHHHGCQTPGSSHHQVQSSATGTR